MSSSFPESTVRWADNASETLLRFVDAAEEISSPQALRAFPSLDALVQDRKRHRIITPRGSRLRSVEKKAVAEGIYHSLHYRYGFEEALETGNWTPWPDECRMVNCYGQSVVNYLVAQSCGLNPVLVEFVGLQREGDTHRAGHSLVVVDVGEATKPEPWIIDQPMGMYGPVAIGKSTMAVENLAARQGQIHRKDYREETHGFLLNIASTEEDIVRQMEQLRSHPEAVLYPGQRVGVPPVDAWQSEEPMGALWFLKFIPDPTGKTRGDIVSRIMLDRPGIKSRGLEYRITLGSEGTVQDEHLFGYYCAGSLWADFADPVPLVQLPFGEMGSLIEGLADIPPKERAAFEMTLMKESVHPSPQQAGRIRAAQESFDRVRESEYGDIVMAMVAAEALYQHEKRAKASYLRPAEREKAIKRLRTAHPLIEYYAQARKLRHRAAKTRELLERRPGLIAGAQLLRPNQLEDERTRAFLALRTEQERLEHIFDHRPTYFDDAIDRLVFYDKKIRGKEDDVLDIARTAFGPDYERTLFSAYTRIFAEFLGHIAVSFPYLSLDGYKQKIVEKITSTH